MNINNLIQKAAEYGVISIKDATDPLTPFTLVLDGNNDPKQREMTLTRHLSDMLEESLLIAQNSITPDRDISMYAIVWDGYVTYDKHKWDAILIEVGEAGTAQGALYAQRYEKKEKGLFVKKNRNVAVGKPISVGSSESRL